MVGRGGFPGGSTLIDLPMQESQVLSLGQEDPLEKEMTTNLNGNPLQYSCLGNPMDRGAWQATVHGVAKSQTQLSTHTHQSSECIHIQSKGCSQKYFEEDRIKCDFFYAMKGSPEETHGDLLRSQNPAKAETRYEFRSPIQDPSLPTIYPWLYPWGGRDFVLTHFPSFCFRSLLLLNVFLLKYNCCTQSLLFLIKLLQYLNPHLDPIILSPSPKITTLLNSEFVISTYI